MNQSARNKTGTVSAIIKANLIRRMFCLLLFCVAIPFSATATPTQTPAPRPSATPRIRPTPAPRPSIPPRSPTPTPTASPTPTPTPTCTPSGIPGPWMLAANYPVMIESPAVASNGTSAYSVAGRLAGAADNIVYRYDPVANTWTQLANVPTALYDAGIAYAANTNKIYVFGGFNGTVILNTTQIYDIATNTWSTGAAMPDGRVFPSAAYYSGTGKIYVIGGFDPNSNEANQTWEYDPVANTWNTSRANIPVAMAGAGYSIVGQFVYLAGHWNNGAASTDHYRYDIVANTWASMAPVPVAIYRPAAAGVGTKEYLVGGGNPSAGASGKTRHPASKDAFLKAPVVSYSSTYIYDTVSNTWSTGPNTNVPHAFPGGTAIGNLLLVVGGYNGTADENTVEKSVIEVQCGNAYTEP